METFQPDAFQNNAFETEQLIYPLGEEIYIRFCERVLSFASSYTSALPVAFPGTHFTTPTSGYWLEVSWFPNETINYGTGFNDGSLLRGIGQITVCCRPGAGIVNALSIADDVIVGFGKGTPLGRALVYRKPWASSVVSADERVMVTMTILWQAGDA